MRIVENGLHYRSGGLSLVALTYLPLALMKGARVHWLFGAYDFTTPIGLDDEPLPRFIRKVAVRFFGFELTVALPCIVTEDWLQVYAARQLARRIERSEGPHRSMADPKEQARTFWDAHSEGRFWRKPDGGKEGETLAWILERTNRELESEEDKDAWNAFFELQRNRFKNECER